MNNISRKKILSLMLTFIIAVAILMFSITIKASAYTDNQGDMASFPAPGATEADALMQNNFGHLGTLYSSGHIVNNNGNIDECNGQVDINYGTIKVVSKTVGTNCGTIERLDGYSTLTVNEKSGTVVINKTKIENNSGNVKENYGEVNMFGGTVELNGASGNVIFSGAAGSGSVMSNKGKITITDTKKLLTVDSNEGTIMIDGGEVTVRENSGTILLINNAILHCTDNSGTIDVSDDASVYVSDCKNNYGTVTFPVNSTGTFSYDNGFYPIVFEGDNDTASVMQCSSVYNDGNYTRQSASLLIMLPFDYECINFGAVRDESAPGCWKLTTYIDYGDTQYTVRCRKSSSSDTEKDLMDEHDSSAKTKMSHDSGVPTYVWIIVSAALIVCCATILYSVIRGNDK